MHLCPGSKAAPGLQFPVLSTVKSILPIWKLSAFPVAYLLLIRSVECVNENSDLRAFSSIVLICAASFIL